MSRPDARVRGRNRSNVGAASTSGLRADGSALLSARYSGGTGGDVKLAANDMFLSS
jgi:hypothetical protein